MSNSDRNSNSGSIAAALGAAVAIDDIENVANDTNSNNNTLSVTKSDDDTVSISKNETETENSYNQDNDNISVSKSDNDTFTKTVSVSDDDTVSVAKNETEHSYNQDNDTITKTVSVSDNDTFTKTITDNDTFTKTVSLSDDDVKDSYNQDNDVSNSNNTTTTDIDTTVDVALTDAFKTIEDSYNSDDDWLQLDNLDFDVMNAVGAGTLAGDGNDGMFNISQVSEMMDKDVLIRPEVKNDAWFEQDAHAHGGHAYGADELGDRSTATTTADGAATLEAFTQNIVMGSNIQYNNVDLSVVGGDSTVNDNGDIG